jgi:hypothetical protein
VNLRATSERYWRALCWAAVLLIGCAPTAQGATERGLIKAPFDVVRTGVIGDKVLREISGMAVSRRDASVLWVHNDSGSRAHLYAITADGQRRARVTLKGATSRDWEDMAAFEMDGEPMLVVADVGDNNGSRSVLWLHFIHEPDLSELEAGAQIEVDVAWSIPFRYPGGAADCESIAVDTEAGQVLLLTKRQNPPQLHALPIKPEGAKPLRGSRIDAVELGPINTIPRPRAEDLLSDPMFGAYSSQPTAMDLTQNELLVLTYRHAYLYSRDDDQSWAEAVAQAPRIVLLPRMLQTESAAFDRDGRDVYVTSERANAPVYRLRRKGPLDTAPEAQPGGQ